jgi:hypothetical protein
MVPGAAFRANNHALAVIPHHFFKAVWTYMLFFTGQFHIIICVKLSEAWKPNLLC